MTGLDSRYPELDWFLQKTRRRLNQRYLAGEAWAAFACAAPVALAAVLLARVGSLRILWWALLVAGAAGVFAALRWRRRLTRGQAASWVDELQANHGLFRAAVDSLDRPKHGLADRAILREADRGGSRVWSSGPLKLPWRRLVLRTFGGVLMAAACLAVLSWEGLPGIPIGGSPKAAQQPASSPTADAPMTGGPNQKAISAKEAAHRLFPEDTRLAALAEQALASGDTGALESLLDQNASAAPRAGSSAPGGKSGSGLEGNSRGDGPSQLVPGQDDQLQPGTGKPGSPSQPSSGSPLPGPGTGGMTKDGSKAAPESGASSPGDSAGRDRSGGSDQRPSSDPGFSGSAGTSGGGPLPGLGHSDQPLGKAPSGKSDKRVVVPEPGRPGVFEYVLPGTGSHQPLSAAVAGSRRSAEAALDRSALPREFDQAVRDYFLKLSQEAQQ